VQDQGWACQLGIASAASGLLAPGGALPPLLPLQTFRSAQSAFCCCDAVQAHVFALRAHKGNARAGHVC